MKVYVHGPYNSVSRIEFCCGEMAEDILKGVVRTHPWTDRALGFWVKNQAGDQYQDNYRLSHCPHCGVEIQGGILDGGEQHG